MSSDDVYSFLGLLLAVGYIVVEVQGRKKQKAMFVACGERLQIQDYNHTPSTMLGKIRGLPLEVHFVGASRQTPAHTTVDVGCPSSAVLLALRPQTAAEQKDVERGDAVDLVLGDPAFDRAWIVEGAPAARIKRVLSSPALRRRLVDFASIQGARITVDKGKVSLYRLGSDIDKDAISTERIEIAVELAEAVIADAEAPLGPGDIAPGESDYRSGGVARAEADGAAQIAALKLIRATRAVHELRPVAIVLTVVLTLLLLGVQRIEDPMAIVPAIILLLVALGVPIGVGTAYRNQRREAPAVVLDTFAMAWMAAFTLIDLGLALRVLLRK
ncbi:MAG: hypothetical protein U0359_16500 [Byssovorax sp.]